MYAQEIKEAGIRDGIINAASDAVTALGRRFQGSAAAARHAAQGVGKGGSKALEMQQAGARALPKEVVNDAQSLAKMIREQGLDPSTMRIGITGTGGTGKSTMGKALGNELGMPMKEVDTLVPKHKIQGRDWSKMPELEQGTIYEQSHLLSGVDPDKFDLIVNLEKSPELIRKQLLERGRGAYQADLYDYPKFQRGVRSAFENTRGNVHNISDVTAAKFRPAGGFQQEAVLNEVLKAKGVNAQGLNRQAQVIAAAEGKRQALPGVLPYLRTDTGLGSAARAAKEGFSDGMSDSYVMNFLNAARGGAK